MISKKMFVLFGVAFYWFLLIGFSPSSANAQEMIPAQEQELADARAAMEAAQKAKAEKYSLENLQQAQDFLVIADHARQFKDGVKFTQACRLARVYAELAKTVAELRSEEEKLAATQEELQKAKAEINRLKRSQ